MLASPPTATGQCPLSKITEAASNDIDEFGWTMVLDGELLAVGELGADEAGAVHMFDVSDMAAFGSFVEIAEVIPDDAAPGKRFSEVLALSGDTLAVGAPSDDESFFNAGAVYVFERDDNTTPANPLDDSWVQTQKLHGGGVSPPERFGDSLALVGDTLVVGARGNGLAAAVYVFHRDDNGTAGNALDDLWIQAARVDDDGLSTFTHLGDSVALSDDEALIRAGDPWDSTGVGARGAAVILGW